MTTDRSVGAHPMFQDHAGVPHAPSDLAVFMEPRADHEVGIERVTEIAEPTFSAFTIVVPATTEITQLLGNDPDRGRTLFVLPSNSPAGLIIGRKEQLSGGYSGYYLSPGVVHETKTIREVYAKLPAGAVGLAAGGVATVVPVANPAPGADWSLTVPAGHQYQLQSLRAVLGTSAAVANRVPEFKVTRGATVIWSQKAAGVLAASVTGSFVLSPFASVSSNNGQQVLPGPGFILQPGDVLSTTTSAIDAADQWSAIAATVQDLSLAGGVPVYVWSEYGNTGETGQN